MASASCCKAGSCSLLSEDFIDTMGSSSVLGFISAMMAWMALADCVAQFPFSKIGKFRH